MDESVAFVRRSDDESNAVFHQLLLPFAFLLLPYCG
jgi:hypothetical protein